MKTIGSMLAAVVLAIVVFFGFAFVQRNGIIQKDEAAQAAWGQVEATLQRRLDLIPNLVETVRGYATHERDTLDAVIAARNKAAQGGVNSGDEAQLRVSLDRLLALSEAYPDLKANGNFQALQSELADVEDKLAAARRALNAAVSRYNAAIETFPAVLTSRGAR